MIYAPIKVGESYAVQNLNDGSTVKGNSGIVTFRLEKQAQAMCAYLQDHFDAIAAASSVWHIRESTGDEIVMKHVRL